MFGVQKTYGAKIVADGYVQRHEHLIKLCKANQFSKKANQFCF